MPLTKKSSFLVVHHGFVTIINMTICWFWIKYLTILQFVLIYIYDVKLISQKYH